MRVSVKHTAMNSVQIQKKVKSETYIRTHMSHTAIHYLTDALNSFIRNKRPEYTKGGPQKQTCVHQKRPTKETCVHQDGPAKETYRFIDVYRSPL